MVAPAGSRAFGVAVALAAVVLGTLVTASQVLTGTALVLVVNLGVLVLAVGASLGAGWAARTSTGRQRRGWWAMCAASGSWAVGQVAWTVYENLLMVASPFPSLADLGYLGFPLAGAVGMALLPDRHEVGDVRRRALDALVAACSLTLLSWVSVLHAVVEADTAGTAALVVSLAYPVSDVVLVTVAVIAAAQSAVLRAPLALLAAGIVALAVSDGAFAYLGATTGYTTGSLVDLGWWTGFAVLGLAGVHAATRPGAGPAAGPTASRRATLLPYVPLAAAATAIVVVELRGLELGAVAEVLTGLLVVLVLARQYATVRENATLLARVEHRETELRHQAFHDELTGLANRALFLDRLEHALTLSARDLRTVSVAYLDLDGFKATNDTLGHAAGDELLVRVAERLRGALRATDTLARLGGDEFAVLVESGTQPAVVAHALLDALRSPFVVAGSTTSVSASIGLATLEPGQPVPSSTAFLHRADVAMYAVKDSGRGDFLLHAAGAGLLRRRSEPFESALATALADGGVRVAYQPVVETTTGLLRACEVLARWDHEGVAVPPSTFVPVLDRLGLSAELTDAVLEQGCTQLAAWSAAAGHARLRIAVNVSPGELSDPGLPDRVLDVLARNGLQPRQLALEITESGLARRPETAQDVVRRLRSAGVRIALDDFGTGWSTLAQLAAMPLDTVKIDRVFLADVDHDPHAERFLHGMLDLTRHLGLRSLAEGVERPGQLDVLRRHGCDLVQGYLVERPVPGDELTARVLAGLPLLEPFVPVPSPSRP